MKSAISNRRKPLYMYIMNLIFKFTPWSYILIFISVIFKIYHWTISIDPKLTIIIKFIVESIINDTTENYFWFRGFCYLLYLLYLLCDHLFYLYFFRNFYHCGNFFGNFWLSISTLLTAK